MTLIMFDYDGVLVDSYGLLKKIYGRIGDVLRKEMPEKDEHFRELFELDWWKTYRKLNISAKDEVKISEFLFHHMSDKYASFIKPYPDIPQVLKELSKKYTLAVVSNNFRKSMTKRLKEFEIFDYFSALYCAEDGELKPSPDLILKCMKKFDALPEESAFIGDMDGDITSAKAAKVGKIVAVTYGYHLKHRLQDADVIIESPKDLLDLF